MATKVTKGLSELDSMFDEIDPSGTNKVNDKVRLQLRKLETEFKILFAKMQKLK